MATGTKWVIAVAFLIALAAGIGFLIGRRSAKPLIPTPNYRRVKVGPTANDVNPETETLSKDNGDEVFWIAVDKNGQVDKSKKLLIEFDDPEVFRDVQQQPVSHRYRAQCTGWSCYSGVIHPNAAYRKYAYTQILQPANDPSAPPEKADGHIIIER